MKEIALVTVLFDYPETYIPSFYKNALKFFNQDDIHIVRKSGLIKDGSYYDKLYYYKTVSLVEYLKSNILGRYEYVLFLDATDTNFIKSSNGLVEKFNKLNCSVILGAELGLWPPTNYTHLYNRKRKVSDKIYLNSGTYFGYTEKIVYHLDDIIQKEYQTGIDDQGRWTIQYLLNEDLLIDQECEFFFSTYNSKKNVRINDKKIELLNSNAFIVHDNGPYNEETLKLTQLLNEDN